MQQAPTPIPSDADLNTRVYRTTSVTPLIPLSQEVRLAVDTATAAHHLNRRPQTLRTWASNDSGPIRPRRIFGRLAWLVDDIRRLVQGDEVTTTSGRTQPYADPIRYGATNVRRA